MKVFQSLVRMACYRYRKVRRLQQSHLYDDGRVIPMLRVVYFFRGGDRSARLSSVSYGSYKTRTFIDAVKIFNMSDSRCIRSVVNDDDYEMQQYFTMIHERASIYDSCAPTASSRSISL